MGGCLSSQKIKETTNLQDCKLDDSELEPVKILLLGAGESGKSTVLKQAMTVYGIPLADDSKVSARSMIVTLPENAPFTKQVADSISSLWADEGVQSCYEKRDLFWLLDGASYYFDEVHRIADPHYEPTFEDCIMTRVRTTGIDSIDFVEPPYSYSIVDVGGQRNERRKWINCFENVNAVIFLVGLSGYSQCLFEDNSVNRMYESIKLFKQVVSNPVFKDTPIFLFLNKQDLFEKMIVKHPLKNCFPDYTGVPGDIVSATAHIEKEFRAVMKSVCPGKDLYIQPDVLAHIMNTFTQSMAALRKEDVIKCITEVKSILHGLRTFTVSHNEERTATRTTSARSVQAAAH